MTFDVIDADTALFNSLPVTGAQPTEHFCCVWHVQVHVSPIFQRKEFPVDKNVAVRDHGIAGESIELKGYDEPVPASRFVCAGGFAFLLGTTLAVLLVGSAGASDHLDTPTVQEEPAVDIADLYAWMSPDGKRLNLAMTIFGHAFSLEYQYVFHVDSGPRFGETTATTSIVCRFHTAQEVECQVGDSDLARGDGGTNDKRLQVFAGLRDDPFFNNVKGTRAALNTAIAAVGAGATTDSASCPMFDAATSSTILDLWRQTDGGPAFNFLAGWKVASLVISVDVDVVKPGGALLAAWSATYTLPHGSHGKAQIDRIGRPLTGNGLLGLLASKAESDRLKEEDNASSAVTAWHQFMDKVQAGLALYDGLDGVCGNQWLADRDAAPSNRYRHLAEILTDDRIWIDSASTACTRYLAVEFAALSGQNVTDADCGGRTPDYDTTDILRSLLVMGDVKGVDDGVDRDDQRHSLSKFPFFAAPRNNE